MWAGTPGPAGRRAGTVPAVTATAAPPARRWTVGVLGGTGAQGRGLGRRLGMAGHEVLLGSRDAQRARQVAAGVAGTAPAARLSGAGNAEVAERAEVVVVAVPYAGHADLLADLRGVLAGTVVVDCVNPLAFDRRGPYVLDVPAGSAAEQARDLLPDSTVVAAFHHVSAVLLEDPAVDRVDSDVLVLGDDQAAADVVVGLAASVPGMRGIHAGPLRLARCVEGLTANLIAVNRRYRAHAGLRITDV